MSGRWDAIVVGGGVNGLTAATYLARAGHRVLLLERREDLGGLAAGEEFHPGYRTAGVLQETAVFREWVVDELELGKHGLRRREPKPFLLPRREGEALVVGDEVEGVGAGDVRAYREYRRFLARIRPVLERWTDRPPPDLFASGPRDLLSLGLTGLALRRLGRATMSELLRVAPTSADDWLGERFEDEALRAALAAPAIWASFTGPRSPGTTFNLLLACAGRGRPVGGGPSALVGALANAARAAGAELRTGCEVETLLVGSDGVEGVRLAGGEEIAADRVAAAVDPRRLFLDLFPPARLSQRLARDLRNFRARGTTAQVDLALAGYPEFPGRPGTRAESIRVGETVETLERAFDAIKYRRFAERPLLEISVPTLEMPELAPTGHHVFSILAHFAPLELEDGWHDGTRKELGDRVLEVLEEVAPGIGELVVGRRVSTPEDLGRRHALSGGHLFHGEHAIDQVLMRPTPECARHATPTPGLFLCGAGSHPGGGLTGVPGALGARALLASL